jgi:signal transduction histidine kinase
MTDLKEILKPRALSLYHSLGGRILAGFVLMAFISLIVALAGIFYTSQAGQNFSDTVDKNQQVTFAILKLNVAVERQSASVLNYLLVYNSRVDYVVKYLDDLKEAQNDFQTADHDLHTMFAQFGLSSDSLNKTERLYQAFSDNVEQVLVTAESISNTKTKGSVDPVDLWEGPGQSTKEVLVAAINENLSLYTTQTQSRTTLARQQGVSITIISLALVLVAGIGGTIGAVLITRSITRPLRRLANVANAVRSGNLNVIVNTPKGSDEVAILAAAMADMTADLRRSRQELEESLLRTRRRNRELTAVNRVTKALSRSLDLYTILQEALSELIDVTEAGHGIMYLTEDDGQVVRVTSQNQNITAKADFELFEEAGNSLVAQVLAQSEVQVTPSSPNAVSEVHFYVAIPLKSKNKVLGVATLNRVQLDQITVEDRELYAAIGNQIGIAIENAQLYGQAQQLAALEERNRLARDLHDSVTQTVFSVTLAAEAARAMYIKKPEKVEAQLERIQSLSRGALTEMRSLIFQLRPAALEEQGLIVAIQKHLDALQSRESVKIHFEVVGEGRLSKEHEQTLYRVAQEATNNIVKHAKASEAWVRLVIGESEASLSIADNGVGFEQDAASLRNQERKSLGMTSMQERAALAGGHLEVMSAAGQGTTVTISVPLKLVPRPAGLGVVG